MTSTKPDWLLLVISLPTDSATVRMRIWRALKTLGCAALRDGAYLLPFEPLHQQQLGALADEATREGGSAWLLVVQPRTTAELTKYRALFDRSAQYAACVDACAEARLLLAGSSAQEVSRLLRKLRREYDAVRATDFFPDEGSAHAEAAWIDFVKVAEARLSPGEPQAIDATIVPRDPSQFQGMLWATRRHLRVDRVASAWLIRRFIDRTARFVWLAALADCPDDALGFDFNGAPFTHVGERVTFEVLLASFDLAGDPGLARLAALVRVLDTGAGFVAEAGGFDAMLAGARQRAADDDQFLVEVGVMLDALYAHFSIDPTVAAQAATELP